MAERAHARQDRFRRLSIENRLAAEIADARARKYAATQAFHGAIAAVPSGIPTPDSNLRIKQAHAELEASAAGMPCGPRSIRRVRNSR